MLITIVELPEFVKQSKRLLTPLEISQLIFYLSSHPKDGVLIQGTGGVRKIRWSREGKGKRGGVRVIYFYYNKNIPLFLLTVFPKSEKTNLSKEEINELNKFTKILVNNYKKR